MSRVLIDKLTVSAQEVSLTHRGAHYYALSSARRLQFASSHIVSARHVFPPNCPKFCSLPTKMLHASFPGKLAVFCMFYASASKHLDILLKQIMNVLVLSHEICQGQSWWPATRVSTWRQFESVHFRLAATCSRHEDVSLGILKQRKHQKYTSVDSELSQNKHEYYSTRCHASWVARNTRPRELDRFLISEGRDSVKFGLLQRASSNWWTQNCIQIIGDTSILLRLNINWK